MEQGRADKRIASEAIQTFIADSLRIVGLPAGDAAKAAELMLEADLTGADAHGVFRLPQYVRRLRGGGINATPNIRVEKTAAQRRWSTATMAWAIWSWRARPKRQSNSRARAAS